MKPRGSSTSASANWGVLLKKRVLCGKRKRVFRRQMGGKREKKIRTVEKYPEKASKEFGSIRIQKEKNDSGNKLRVWKRGMGKRKRSKA